jgi:Fe-S-cluster-containing dehydrogenase component
MADAILIDYGFCSGCHSCEIACKNEHNIPLGQWGIKLSETGPFEIGKDRFVWDYIPVPTDLCDLCEERRSRGEKAACELVCQCKSIIVGPMEELSKKADEIGIKTVIFVP